MIRPSYALVYKFPVSGRSKPKEGFKGRTQGRGVRAPPPWGHQRVEQRIGSLLSDTIAKIIKTQLRFEIHQNS